jgi:hypothetical protein
MPGLGMDVATAEMPSPSDTPLVSLSTKADALGEPVPVAYGEA